MQAAMSDEVLGVVAKPIDDKVVAEVVKKGRAPVAPRDLNLIQRGQLAKALMPPYVIKERAFSTLVSKIRSALRDVLYDVPGSGLPLIKDTTLAPLVDRVIANVCYSYFANIDYSMYAHTVFRFCLLPEYPVLADALKVTEAVTKHRYEEDKRKRPHRYKPQDQPTEVELREQVGVWHKELRAFAKQHAISWEDILKTFCYVKNADEEIKKERALAASLRRQEKARKEAKEQEASKEEEDLRERTLSLNFNLTFPSAKEAQDALDYFVIVLNEILPAR